MQTDYPAKQREEETFTHRLVCCSHWAAPCEKTIRFEHQSNNRNLKTAQIWCCSIVFVLTKPAEGDGFLFLVLANRWAGFFSSWSAVVLSNTAPKRAALVTAWHCPGGLVRFKKCSVKFFGILRPIELSSPDYPAAALVTISGDSWQQLPFILWKASVWPNLSAQTKLNKSKQRCLIGLTTFLTLSKRRIWEFFFLYSSKWTI